MKAKYDIVCVNKGETEIFPYDEFRINIMGSDPSDTPCLYIEALREDFCVKANFDGIIVKVIRCCQRGTNSIECYRELEKRLKEWLPKQSKDTNANGRTNSEWVRFVWNIVHD